MIADLANAISLLESGNVVGMPTETVYGLAARLDRPEGLQKIFRVKERPFFDPLIVHVASIGQARTCARVWSPAAQVLAEKFWPGPLTLVVEKSDLVPGLVTSGLATVGLRSPDHPMALDLIRQSGPLAAPSANRFGRTSPTQALHVESEFAGQVAVLDGGSCAVGIESTIVSVESDGILRLLRPGKVTAPRISAILRQAGIAHQWETAQKVRAPGQMQHHYMPDIPLVILGGDRDDGWILQETARRWAELPAEIEGVRLQRPTQFRNLKRLQLSADSAIAARELYQRLREAADPSGKVDLLVLVWPEDRRSGAWEAVWDRLRKAASLSLI